MENLSIPRVALLLFAGALILSVAIGTTLFVMEREEQRLPPVAQPSPTTTTNPLELPEFEVKTLVGSYGRGSIQSPGIRMGKE